MYGRSKRYFEADAVSRKQVIEEPGRSSFVSGLIVTIQLVGIFRSMGFDPETTDSNRSDPLVLNYSNFSQKDLIDLRGRPLREISR